MSAKANFKHGAFTLIEIMIVVAIIALVMAIGLPPFVRTVKKKPLQQAVNAIMEGCNYARSQAIFQGVPMDFVIRAEDGQMTVRPARTASGDGNEASADLLDDHTRAKSGIGASGFTEYLADTIAVHLLDVNFVPQMEFAAARVRFYPNGTSDEFTMVLEEDGQWRKITLEPVTGLAAVESDPTKWR